MVAMLMLVHLSLFLLRIVEGEELSLTHCVEIPAQMCYLGRFVPPFVDWMPIVAIS